MILPIVAYGDPILKQEAEEIESDYAGLNELIDNMYETMYNAEGVGLAAPQVGLSIRMFIVDARPFAEPDDDATANERDSLEQLTDFKKVFINPIILEEKGDKWAFREGCLSIPHIREDVMRQPQITIEYYDQHFELKEETYRGMAARIIQHEYDHIEGVLFTDHLNPLRKQFLKKKLQDISKGVVPVEYKMKYHKPKR